jgi:hypothetical protein
MVERGSGSGVSFTFSLYLSLCGSSEKGAWREGSLAGDHEGYLEKALKWASLFIGLRLGNLEEGSFTGDFVSWMKGLWGMGAFLSQEAPWRRPRGGLLSWGTRKIRFLKDMQKCRLSGLSSIGALLGNLEGVRLPGLLREMNRISECLFGPYGNENEEESQRFFN